MKRELRSPPTNMIMERAFDEYRDLSDTAVDLCLHGAGEAPADGISKPRQSLQDNHRSSVEKAHAARRMSYHVAKSHDVVTDPFIIEPGGGRS